MWRFILLGVVIIGVVVVGISLMDTSATGDVTASAVLSNVETDTSGFARAIGPYDWSFPADFGPHPDFQTEWWYYTGNLATEEGRNAAQVSLVAAVANGWLALLADEELLDLSRQTLSSREESVRLTKMRLDAGVASELDFRQAESLTQAARATLAQQQRQRALDENALALLLGQPLPSEIAASLTGSRLVNADIGDYTIVLDHCVITDARVASHCSIGPFAHLRPEAVIEEGARVGNFVEIKKSTLGAGAKASHLTYIGDATVGAKTNIGAGTITCNFDGATKHQTVIGANAFVGSHSTLVAPITIGDGAYIAAGSAITSDVPPDALGIGRSRQENKPEWAAKRRATQKPRARHS